ncbi:MAG: 5-formyltetrahydrofolate cyclo-ligase [Chlamydiae bacterium RIFCSPHIGHO2_12_FULL_49_9]|nr:MAG: 5-formyltetrahydrofolate cyclo-ligase [Chlamydiae bacterium RIFCSPHIGHO2_12_FULL_49_9]HLB53027.1 5-formyltetrahydrofolate cyclo-ligase [Chlamydiales bacterium]
MIQKAELRRRLLDSRRSISHKRRLEASLSLFNRLKDKGPILSFFPIRNEIDTTLLNKFLAKTGILFLPRVEDNRLIPYRVTDLETQLEISSYGIPEPNPNICEKASFPKISLILVPGLGFNRDGYRLGYGKGYYDNLLGSAKTSFSLGIGFKEQLVEKLPRDAWDIPTSELFLV